MIGPHPDELWTPKKESWRCGIFTCIIETVECLVADLANIFTHPHVVISQTLRLRMHSTSFCFISVTRKRSRIPLLDLYWKPLSWALPVRLLHEELTYKFLNQRSCILLCFTYCLSVYNLHRSAVFVEILSSTLLCGDVFCCCFFCFFHNVDEKTQTGKILVFPKKGWSLWSLFRSLITSLTTELYRELI